MSFMGVLNTFDALALYLFRRGFNTDPITIKDSETAVVRNKKDARSFCHVVIGRPTIYAALSEMEALPDEFICGLLLHEMAHILINEDGGDPELGVDEWILSNVPAAGYRYGNVKYYSIGRNRKQREARNVEKVSKKFLRTIIN